MPLWHTFTPQRLEYKKGALTSGRRQSVTSLCFLRFQEKEPKKQQSNENVKFFIPGCFLLERDAEQLCEQGIYLKLKHGAFLQDACGAYVKSN